MSFKDLQRALVLLGLLVLAIYLFSDVPMSELISSVQSRIGW